MCAKPTTPLHAVITQLTDRFQRLLRKVNSPLKYPRDL